MAKINGLFGSMTGKVADVVMAVRGGEQIVRKYQPTVLNPNTAGQIEARAKLKLMSQLSAVMAPAIAIRKIGNVTSRNLFLKKNYPLATYRELTANVNLAAVQLTDSVVGLPPINATRDARQLTAALSYADTELNRVVYVVLAKNEDNSLRFVKSQVAEGGANNTFEASIGIPTLPVVVYAYGIRDNTDAARAIFGNLTAPTAEQVAKLIVSRTLTEADVTLTETRGIEVAMPQP